MPYKNHKSVTKADLKNFVIIHPGLLQRLLRPRHCPSCNCDSKRKLKLTAGQTAEHSGSTSQGEQRRSSAVLKPRKKDKGNRNLKLAKLYNCIFCNKSFQLLSSLHMHTRMHIDENPYQCRVCPFSCKWYNQLKTHQKTHCESASSEGKSEVPKTREIGGAPRQRNGTRSAGQYTKVSCRICERTFGNNGELEAHYTESHKLPVVRLRRLVITTM